MYCDDFLGIIGFVKQAWKNKTSVKVLVASICTNLKPFHIGRLLQDARQDSRGPAMLVLHELALSAILQRFAVKLMTL